MPLLYMVFRETGRGIVCMCYITLKTPSIQSSWLMFHGFIAEGVLVNNGKHISVTTLVNPSSPLLFICTIDVRLHRFIYIYAKDIFVWSGTSPCYLHLCTEAYFIRSGVLLLLTCQKGTKVVNYSAPKVALGISWVLGKREQIRPKIMANWNKLRTKIGRGKLEQVHARPTLRGCISYSLESLIDIIFNVINVVSTTSTTGLQSFPINALSFNSVSYVLLRNTTFNN